MLNLRLIVSLAILLGMQILLYFGCEIFQKDFHNVLRPIDSKIPFIEASVLIYVLWFPLIVLFPLALYDALPDMYGMYYVSMALEVIISVICYLIYPTTFDRPTTSDTWAGKLMKLVYSGSFRGVNCAPSLHCSSCYLVILCALTCPMMPVVIQVISIVIAVGIVISTMTTKQHAFIDAMTAIPVAVVCWIIGQCFPADQLVRWIVG